MINYQKLKYGLLLFLILLIVVSMLLGVHKLSISVLWNLVLKWLFNDSWGLSLEELILWRIRLPRILLSVLLGASLSASGVVAQGIFRNHLADPGVIGVSAGAGLAAIIGISLGVDEKNLWVTPILAAAGGVSTLIILFIFTRGQNNEGQNNFSIILLIGFALSGLFTAIISLLISLQSEEYSVSIKVFEWLLGSFESKGWNFLFYALPFSLIGIFLSFSIVKELDLLHLGFEVAHSLGSSQRSILWRGILSVGILVGTVTAMVGMIGFIGLMVPHIARFLVGGMHKKLLVISILIGGLLMLTVDTISRSFVQFGLPPGVITSLMGAPFFLWLVKRQKSI